MGRLTTHVLDTANGRPAAGVRIALYRAEDQNRAVAAATTNSDGRCDGPILEGEEFGAGVYELIFHVGDYFRDAGREGPSPPLPRRGRGPLRHRQRRRALPRPPAGFSVRLHDLPGELKRPSLDTALRAYSV